MPQSSSACRPCGSRPACCRADVPRPTSPGATQPCTPPTPAATTSSSWADESPDQPPPCCSLVSATTWQSWTRRPSPATLDAVKQAPDAANFQFRAHNQWLSGTHNRSTITDYHGIGAERSHQRTFVFDADHPAVLVGQDHGPTPAEFVLHALAACLTAGLANIAAARRVRLTQVRSTVTGDIDLNGTLGLNPDVRNGYQQLTVRFTIKGDTPAEKLRELVTQSRARSAVYDIITNRVPVTIEVDTR